MNDVRLLEGFYKLSRDERLARLKQFCGLQDEDIRVLSGESVIDPEMADSFIENAIGFFSIPLGVATNFRIDGRDLVIPMAVEETSIIAAASATAKWVRQEGDIRTQTQGRLIIGQIQFPSITNAQAMRDVLQAHRDELIEQANRYVPGLVQRGGGVRDLSFRTMPRSDGAGTMAVLHVLCDPCDAMGANLINQVCEALKPSVEKLTGEQVGLCILSNLVDTRLAVADVTVHNIDPEVGFGIQEASIFAQTDPYRAATHNKGIMNAIDPILIATGNDWRAVEAGVHAFASRSGRYQPVSRWWMADQALRGRIEIPMAVGTVGGVTRSHPTARIAMKMLRVQTADELGRICAAVGLVQNLAALKALSTVGIVKGHMRLHAANLAIAAGAELHEVGPVKERLAEVLKTEKQITLTHAREVLESLRAQQQ